MHEQERYTEGQRRLLRIDRSTLTEEEKEQLRRALLPRKRFVPKTDEECFLLVAEFLGDAKYRAFRRLLEAILSRYSCSQRWSAGGRDWRLLLRLYCGKQVLCSIGILEDRYFLLMDWGERECKRFEELRDTFPREEVQWTFDFFRLRNGVKHLQWDTEQEGWADYLFPLLAIGRLPEFE